MSFVLTNKVFGTVERSKKQKFDIDGKSDQYECKDMDR